MPTKLSKTELSNHDSEVMQISGEIVDIVAIKSSNFGMINLALVTKVEGSHLVASDVTILP